MIKWVRRELDTIYGPVRNIFFGVEDAPADGETPDGAAPSAARGRAPDAVPLTASEEDELASELESAEGLLGAVLWNSNLAALRHLHHHVFARHPRVQANLRQPRGPPLAGLTVVELGAGVGSLGIALARAGATVLVTDLPDLYPLMSANRKLNAAQIAAGQAPPPDDGGPSPQHGGGRCEVLGWRWGPTDTIGLNPHKRLRQRESGAAKAAKQQKHTERSSSSGGGGGGGPADVASVVRDMLQDLAAPSQSCQAAARLLFKGRPPPHRVDYVVMCDALYGNPKDWPALLYTLSEILLVLHQGDPRDAGVAPPQGCQIINFCEQRVRNVEAQFLALLHSQNEKNEQRYRAYSAPRGTATAAWREAVRADMIARLAETIQDRQKEDILMAAVDLQQLRALSPAPADGGGMRYWNWKRSEMEEEKSELGMPIFVTEMTLGTTRGDSLLIVDPSTAPTPTDGERTAAAAAPQKKEKRPRND
ncbi:hypothetical protein STCU_12215 [Strigomonas culicis]|uniref:Methyltransferase n=1 Tax=Strigomonas culicis TaxID=28005 RepID=S9UKQ0_9TRYP|nr:hypothetical protein STCU_12215 [Strigomonas culicis]|eukprot:EPY15236.1 hypothetical protein STCU_12215 [Strigomonas culicis]